MGIPFDEKELEISGIVPATAKTPAFEKFTYPIPEREAYRNTLAGHPTWLITGYETQRFYPSVNPEAIARGMVAEAKPFNAAEQAGGLDMFGIEWVFMPAVGGSMEVECERLLEDVNDWKEVVKFPDVDSWDWEGSAELNKDYIDPDKFIQPWLYTGWFERLISFMGFEEAAVALLDEDQEDAVRDLMMALSDTYNDIIDHYVKYFDHIDSFLIHDDWGSQMAPFFSPDVAADLIVPAMKKVTDHLHELGLYSELHSCGNHGAQQIKNIIAAGWDAWMPQKMNNIDALWQQYGDKILLCPQIPQNLKDMTEEEQIAAADEYVQKYCTTPGKPVFINMYDKALLTPAFAKEMYKQSRLAYNEWPEA